MDLIKYFSTVPDNVLCKVYAQIQKYNETETLTEDLDYLQAVVDYIRRYSKEIHDVTDIEISLSIEMASRFYKYSDLISKGNAYNQVRWERDVAIDQLHDIGCELGQKMDHIKEKIKQADMMQRRITKSKYPPCFSNPKRCFRI